MIYIIAILGLLVGSFLNVCIYRIPLRETVVTKPSHCTKCGARIKWYDLIPLLSFFILRGKCRSCNEKISIRYPAIEFFNAVLWIIVYLNFSFSVTAIFYMILCSALIIICVIDYKNLIIPDGILIFLLIFGVLFNIISLDKSDLINAFIGFFIISVPLLLISMLTKGGIGGGDIKLMAVCGLYIGYKLISVAFFLGIFLAGILSFLLLLLKFKRKGDIIPLGPFLSLGIMLTLFIGNNLVSWYLQFFK